MMCPVMPGGVKAKPSGRRRADDLDPACWTAWDRKTVTGPDYPIRVGRPVERPGASTSTR